MLELSNRKLENGEVVTAKGRLDATTSRLFDAHCRGLLHSSCKCVVFDFHELQFLSSDGLRTILGLAKCIHAGGGKLVFTGISGPVRDMFAIAGFLETFSVVDQVEPDIA